VFKAENHGVSCLRKGGGPGGKKWEGEKSKKGRETELVSKVDIKQMKDDLGRVSLLNERRWKFIEESTGMRSVTPAHFIKRGQRDGNNGETQSQEGPLGWEKEPYPEEDSP